MRLYVGNLPFSINEAELRQLFEAHGPVDSAAVVIDRETGRPRGFGFVEMTNSDDGNKAITAMNGQDVGGRAIVVNEARPREERSGGGGGGGWGGGSRGGGGGRSFGGGGGGGGRGGDRGAPRGGGGGRW